MSVPTPHKRKSAKRSDRTLSREELSDELDVHPDTIKRHHSRSNPPPHERRSGKCFYNAAEYLAWMDEEGLSGERGRPAGELPPDLEAARLRKEIALARKHELFNAREERLLIPIADVQQWIGEHIGRAKNKLIGMASALAPRLEGLDTGERQAEIEKYVEQVIGEIRDAQADLA